jgi:hypothetical protein
MAAQTSPCNAIARLIPGDERLWRVGTISPHAGYVGRRSHAVRHLARACADRSDPIAGPMNLVRPTLRLGMADALRDRLHGRPLDIRATSNTESRRSFTK